MKLLLLIFSMGVFNYFLTTSSNIIEDKDALSIVSLLQEDGLYEAEGDVSLVMKKEHTYAVYLFDTISYDLTAELVKDIPMSGALYRTLLLEDGSFTFDQVDSGIYKIVICAIDNDDNHKILSINGIGGIDPSYVKIGHHISIMLEAHERGENMFSY